MVDPGDVCAAMSMKRLHLALIVCAAGCAREPIAPPSESSCQAPPMRIAATDEVDLLFVIDNDYIGPLVENELAQRIHFVDEQIAAIVAAGGSIDFHLGITTTDFGAGATGAPGCQPSPGGQQGKLQAVGIFGPNTCQSPVGASFAAMHFGSDGTVTGNLPPKQTLDMTVTCMGAVGGSGCGFRHPLEASFAALQQGAAGNEGFLRDEAQLVVAWLTNTDDCSASPTVDIFNKNNRSYGYEGNIRCVRAGVLCGDPPMEIPYASSNGPLANCVPAPNPGNMDPNRLFDVSRYIDFFARHGGVKRDASDVALVLVSGAPSPFQIILTNPGIVVPPSVSCGALNEMSNPPCVPERDISCFNMAQPDFFGAPPIRLGAVVAAASRHFVQSICDANLSPTLQAVADFATTSLASAPHCLTSALPDPVHPDCVVEDVTVDENGVTTVVELPQCDGHTMPCWLVEKKVACAKMSPDAMGVTLQRSNPLGIGSSTRVTCAAKCF
jgi:hypothetical protein